MTSICLCVEPVPDNSANAVKVAVAKNFDDLVTKNEKVIIVNDCPNTIRITCSWSNSYEYGT